MNTISKELTQNQNTYTHWLFNCNRNNKHSSGCDVMLYFCNWVSTREFLKEIKFQNAQICSFALHLEKNFFVLSNILI